MLHSCSLDVQSLLLGETERAWEKQRHEEEKQASMWCSRLEEGVCCWWCCQRDERIVSPVHTTSEFTVGHALKKSASKLHIGFQFVWWAQSVWSEFGMGAAAHQSHRRLLSERMARNVITIYLIPSYIGWRWCSAAVYHSITPFIHPLTTAVTLFVEKRRNWVA